MLTSMTGHDCVLLRADDPLIDMNYITSSPINVSYPIGIFIITS